MIIKIEINKGLGWTVRSEGNVPADTSYDKIVRHVDSCCIKHPHRAIVDGVMIYERGKLTSKEFKAIFHAQA